MKAWSPKRILALLLAVFVTVGFGISAVQANSMAVAMAMMSDRDVAIASDNDMAMQSDGDCQACFSSPSKHGKPMDCSPVCVPPVLAVPPTGLAVALGVGKLTPVLPTSALLRGHPFRPDPSPPRSIDIA